MQTNSSKTSTRCAQVLLLGTIVGSTCAQSCELETIAQATAANGTYDYSQEKFIPALDRTLHSNGTLWLTATSKLIWQMQQPIQSTMVFSETGMQQYNDEGEPGLVSSDPLFSELSQVFISLLQGKYLDLESQFQLDLSCNEETEDWNLSLTPVVPRFSGILSSISLAGNTRLEFIAYEEVRGDRTTLRLSISNAPLNSDYLE